MRVRAADGKTEGEGVRMEVKVKCRNREGSTDEEWGEKVPRKWVRGHRRRGG